MRSTLSRDPVPEIDRLGVFRGDGFAPIQSGNGQGGDITGVGVSIGFHGHGPGGSAMGAAGQFPAQYLPVGSPALPYAKPTGGYSFRLALR